MGNIVGLALIVVTLGDYAVTKIPKVFEAFSGIYESMSATIRSFRGIEASETLINESEAAEIAENYS